MSFSTKEIGGIAAGTAIMTGVIELYKWSNDEKPEWKKNALISATGAAGTVALAHFATSLLYLRNRPNTPKSLFSFLMMKLAHENSHILAIYGAVGIHTIRHLINEQFKSDDKSPDPL